MEKEIDACLGTTVEFIRNRIGYTEVKWAIVLGSGLGEVKSLLSRKVILSFNKIPFFNPTTNSTHAGNLIFGYIDEQPVLLMEGRLHYYEGFSLEEVTYPIRVLRALGVEKLMLTCAAGAMRENFHLGEVVIIQDHINFIGESPLRGKNVNLQGPRHPDMSRPYDPELFDLITDEFKVKPAVLAAVPGPQLETPSEYRFLSQWADLVTMSTVPEVIVARHCGLKVLAFAVVTDKCIWFSLSETTLDEIIHNAKLGANILKEMVPSIIRK